MEPTEMPDKRGNDHYGLWYVLSATELLQLGKVWCLYCTHHSSFRGSSIRTVKRQKLTRYILKWCNSKIILACAPFYDPAAAVSVTILHVMAFTYNHPYFICDETTIASPHATSKHTASSLNWRFKGHKFASHTWWVNLENTRRGQAESHKNHVGGIVVLVIVAQQREMRLVRQKAVARTRRATYLAETYMYLQQERLASPEPRKTRFQKRASIYQQQQTDTVTPGERTLF